MPFIHNLDNRYFIQQGGVGSLHGDRNNCTVRALSNALGWTIEQGTNYMKQFGRVKNKGANLEQFTPAYKLAKFDKIRVFGSGRVSGYVASQVGKEASKGTTFGNLLLDPKYRKGTHIIIVSGHAVCIKEGEPIDMEGTVINKNKRVLMSFSKE